MIKLLVTLFILALIVAVILVSNAVGEEKAIKRGKEIHKQHLIERLEIIKDLVERNDNDLKLGVIDAREHEQQNKNFSKQIDEIEKELKNDNRQKS